MHLRSAVISAKGIGDALLMMIAVSRLKEAGYEPTLFHESPNLILDLFPNFNILSYPTDIQELKKFDLIIVQNDNSKRSWDLLRSRKNGELNNVIFFHTKPCKLAIESDFVLNPKFPMATNIAHVCKKLLKTSFNKNNSLDMPKDCFYHYHPMRIVIHPTSGNKLKNWTPSQYIKLATVLKKRGYEPVFTMTETEKLQWDCLKDEGFSIVTFPKLSKLANYLYESGFFIGNDSGIGHLASNIKLPTLTISGNNKLIKLWQPDFHRGKVATIKFPLPNFKGINFCMRDQYWQKFVTVNSVVTKFKRLRCHE